MICYEKVYCIGQADTSAKQRIVVPISRVTVNASRLVPCLGKRQLAAGGAASQIIKRSTSPLPLPLTSLIGRDQPLHFNIYALP